MKLIGLMIVFGLAMPGAWGQAAKNAKPAPKAAAQGAELPAGAEKVKDGVWKYKDKDGKTWFYTRTPFGFAKGTDDPSATSESAKTENLIKVTAVDGDTVRLERPTPFGGSRWTKSVSDLTDDEKDALERFKAKQNSK